MCLQDLIKAMLTKFRLDKISIKTDAESFNSIKDGNSNFEIENIFSLNFSPVS